MFQTLMVLVFKKKNPANATKREGNEPQRARRGRGMRVMCGQMARDLKKK